MTVAAGHWMAKTCSLAANEVLNQPLVCIRSTWADQSRTRPDKGGSLAFPKVCPFKTSRTLGHKLPHFIKWRQDRMRAETAFLRAQGNYCLSLHSLSERLRDCVLQSNRAEGKQLGKMFVSWIWNDDRSSNCLGISISVLSTTFNLSFPALSGFLILRGSPGG